MQAIPTDYITLSEYVAARSATASHHELLSEFGDFESNELFRGVSGRSYLSREYSVRDLYRKLNAGSVEGFLQDPRSGEVRRLPREMWHRLAFWQDTLRSGVIRAAACEPLERYNGVCVFVRREAVVKNRQRRKPATMKAMCKHWLEGLVRASPQERTKTKSELRKEARARFGITWREFQECWKAVFELVPEATWRAAGAPRKS